MLAIFLQTLPFFALIGLGWLAGKMRFFPAEATRWLTHFVFWFALSAMLFRFAATLPIEQLFDPAFVAALPQASVDAAIARSRAAGIDAWVLGEVADAATTEPVAGVEVVQGAKGVHGGAVQVVGEHA